MIALILFIILAGLISAVAYYWKKGMKMISSIVLILLQFTGIIQPDINQSFWKWYIPVCIIEMIIYFICLGRFGKSK